MMYFENNNNSFWYKDIQYLILCEVSPYDFSYSVDSFQMSLEMLWSSKGYIT